MGNKPVKEQQREEILVKVVPPLDRAYVRWLARDLEGIYGFTPRNCHAVKPPDHYIEYMHLNGWLDVDLDDPDLAHLFPVVAICLAGSMPFVVANLGMLSRLLEE